MRNKQTFATGGLIAPATPIYAAVVNAQGFNPRNGADYSADAIAARATDADRERGARIVARLGEGGEG